MRVSVLCQKRRINMHGCVLRVPVYGTISCVRKFPTASDTKKNDERIDEREQTEREIHNIHGRRITGTRKPNEGRGGMDLFLG